MPDQVQVDVKVLGQTVVERLAESIAALNKQVEALDQQFVAGEVDAAEYTKQMRHLNTAVAQQEQLLRRATPVIQEAAEEVEDLGHAAEVAWPSLERATQKVEHLGTATAAVGKSGVNAGRSMLELSRGVQDFSAAGIAGIVNNFEGLALALGLGSGIAGVATVAAVGLSLVAGSLGKVWDNLKSEDVKNADALAEALDEMGKASDKLKDKLRELKQEQDPALQRLKDENREMETRVKLEQERIKQRDREKDQLQEQAAAFEKLKGAPTPAQAADEERRRGLAGRVGPILAGPAAGVVQGALAGPGYQRVLQSLQERRDAALARAATAGEREMIARRYGPAITAVQQAQAAGAPIGAADLAGLHPDVRQAVEQAGGGRALFDIRQGLAIAGRAAAGEDEAIAQAARALPPGPLREQLEGLTFGGRFAAGARELAGGVMPLARGAVEGQIGRARAVGEAVQEALRGAGRRRFAAGEAAAVAGFTEMRANEARMLQERTQMGQEQAREDRRATDKARHDRESQARKDEQFHDESRRRFGRLQDVDVMAGQYAAMGARERAASARGLREYAARGLYEQDPTLGREEVARRAAEFPAYLQQRAAGLAAAQGIRPDQLAEFQSQVGQNAQLADQQNQGPFAVIEGMIGTVRHTNRQMAQNNQNWGKIDRHTQNWTDASGNGF